MKKMGGKDATNAILANLRSKSFKIFWVSMPRTPQNRAKKFFSLLARLKKFFVQFLPENQPDHLETLILKCSISFCPCSQAKINTLQWLVKCNNSFTMVTKITNNWCIRSIKLIFTIKVLQG